MQMRVLREPDQIQHFNEVNAHIYFINDSLYTTVEKSLKINTTLYHVFPPKHLLKRFKIQR